MASCAVPAVPAIGRGGGRRPCRRSSTRVKVAGSMGALSVGATAGWASAAGVVGSDAVGGSDTGFCSGRATGTAPRAGALRSICSRSVGAALRNSPEARKASNARWTMMACSVLSIAGGDGEAGADDDGVTDCDSGAKAGVGGVAFETPAAASGATRVVSVRPSGASARSPVAVSARATTVPTSSTRAGGASASRVERCAGDGGLPLRGAVADVRVGGATGDATGGATGGTNRGACAARRSSGTDVP